MKASTCCYAYRCPPGYPNGSSWSHPRQLLRSVSKQYLTLIERLVREGRSEREIDRIVREVVAEDERAEVLEFPSGDSSHQLRAA
jgi:hypothetical protein